MNQNEYPLPSKGWWLWKTDMAISVLLTWVPGQQSTDQLQWWNWWFIHWFVPRTSHAYYVSLTLLGTEGTMLNKFRLVSVLLELIVCCERYSLINVGNHKNVKVFWVLKVIKRIKYIYTHTHMHTHVCVHIHTHAHAQDFSDGSDRKESACNVGDLGLILGSGRSPGKGNGYPFQYSCLEKSMDRGAWWATVHGVKRVIHEWVTNTFTTFSLVYVSVQFSRSVVSDSFRPHE